MIRRDRSVAPPVRLKIPPTLDMSANGSVALARGLLLGVLVSVLMSTSVSVGFEILSYIAFAALPEPRRRLIRALRSPIVIASWTASRTPVPSWRLCVE